MAVPLWVLGVNVLVPSLTVLERPPLALKLVHQGSLLASFERRRILLLQSGLLSDPVYQAIIRLVLYEPVS